MRIREQVRLKHIVEEFRAGLLDDKASAGWCFMVSSALGGYLGFLGYSCILTKGELDLGEDVAEHFWLTLPDGTIIDGTSDQFKQPGGQDMPPVFIGIKPAWYKEVKRE